METILDLAAPDNEFVSAPDLEGGPIPDDEALENIRKSQYIDIPIFTRKPSKHGVLVYVGAGPSMPSFIDEIRKKQQEGCFLMTSNLTNDWLVDRGITPNAVLLIDPKERVKDYIKKPQQETQFYVGTVCNEGVAKGLLEKGMNLEKVLIAYGMPEEKDVKLQKELYGEHDMDFLVGGTMTGLRIMNFCVQLGYRNIEVYGVDSSYGSDAPSLIEEDDPRYEEAVKSNANAFYVDPRNNKKYAILDPPDGGWFYAYKKKHHGELLIARCPDGRKFWTSPVFAHQAKQFVKWYDRFEGKLKITVHGDNLTSHLLKCTLDYRERKRKMVGDKLWSDGYYPMFKEFFANNDHSITFPYVDEAINNGGMALSKALGRDVSLFNYDKHVFEGKERTGKHDIVFTTNLLEHIEQECVENVIRELRSLTKYMCIISIQLGEAKELMSNGEQAHITMKSTNWWESIIKNHFDIVEGLWRGGVNAVFICQSLDAQENRKLECQLLS